MEMERRIAKLKGRRLVIDLPESFEDKEVEVIVSAIDKAPQFARRPHSTIAGHLKIKGDIFDSLPIDDWGLH